MKILTTALYACSAYGIYRLLSDKQPLTGETLLETYSKKLREWLELSVAVKDQLEAEVNEQPSLIYTDRANTLTRTKRASQAPRTISKAKKANTGS